MNIFVHYVILSVAKHAFFNHLPFFTFLIYVFFKSIYMRPADPFAGIAHAGAKPLAGRTASVHFARQRLHLGLCGQ